MTGWPSGPHAFFGALVLTAAVQVFFSPSWLPWHPVSYLEQVLITLCLLNVLMRIPFWIARPVLSPFGHSPIRRGRPLRATQRRRLGQPGSAQPHGLAGAP
jgi:hypothetical protein